MHPNLKNHYNLSNILQRSIDVLSGIEPPYFETPTNSNQPGARQFQEPDPLELVTHIQMDLQRPDVGRIDQIDDTDEANLSPVTVNVPQQCVKDPVAAVWRKDVGIMHQPRITRHLPDGEFPGVEPGDIQQPRRKHRVTDEFALVFRHITGSAVTGEPEPEPLFVLGRAPLDNFMFFIWASQADIKRNPRLKILNEPGQVPLHVVHVVPAKSQLPDRRCEKPVRLIFIMVFFFLLQ